MQSDWQGSFFKDVAVSIWKQAIPPEQTRPEVDYLIWTFGQADKLLDICCGHGRHAIPLAAAGLSSYRARLQPGRSRRSSRGGRHPSGVAAS